MGNGNTTEERHVVFASDGPDDGYGSPRTTTTTYRQTRMDIPANDWDERPVGRVRQQQTKEWLRYDDIEDDYDQEWQQTRRRTGSQPLPNSTRSTTRVGPNTRINRTTSYYPQRSLMTRSFPSAGYHEERSPSRAFNMRDPNDNWYHYRPEVNRRADGALVGRHVMRPASASVRPSSVPPRLYYDNDSATSDPTSDRLRRGTGMVRRTDNPTMHTVKHTVYWEDDDYGSTPYGRYPSQTSYRYQRPTNTSYSYQSYRR